MTARAKDYAQGKSESNLAVHSSCPPHLMITTAKFKNSKFDTEPDLDAFAESFDKGLKGNFSEDSKPQFVKFGSLRDTDSGCDVKDGKLTLQG